MIPIIPEVRWRSLLPNQVSRVCAMNPTTGALRVLHESADHVLEAPNWTPDGRWIVVNSAGSLFRFLADGGGGAGRSALERIDTGALGDLNNDHVLSPDGATIYVSSEGDGHLYAVPIAGGNPVRISEERDGPFGYFVLGISPDASTLAFTGGERRGGRDFVSNLFTMPAIGGSATRLTDGNVDSVGGVYSAAGEWLYFNSEIGAIRPGHAQLHRMRPDGTDIQRLTRDERVNWFPKPLPGDDSVAYLSFAPGTVGHEANVPVELRVLDLVSGEHRVLLHFLGGQGTMNVSGFSPDSSEFAFVAYPVLKE